MADTIKDGGSSTRPPLLVGTNYPSWQARMTAYIKSIDEDVWLTVLEGWAHPTVVLEGKTLDKPQKNWTDEKKKNNNLNSKARNAIFCGVNLEEFSRMSAIASAKEAWESLEIHYEGTASVRIAKLQQLMKKFELIRMKDDKTILEYDGKIRRLANEARLLGDPFPENRLEFEMSMVGELLFFLGFQIKQQDTGIFLNQEKYAKEMVQKFGMEHTKPKATPMGTNEKLHRDSEGVGSDQHLYRSMIGSLLYLTISRPDLCFSVGVCARYQANPKESHLKAVKRILRYVHGTIELGTFYSNSAIVALAGYSDADWAGNGDDQKSTSGGCFYLGKNLVAWYRKKQNSISLSIAEVEYIAVGSCCTQLLWMKQMLADYGFEQDILTVFCDNTSAIDISKKPVQHSRTKHIDIWYHFIRELEAKKIISLEYISTANQLADIFSKILDRTRFEFIQGALGMRHL
ncbi:hypothetical protein H6P81_010324 [Aristolochia fimbriata]|uniref:Reverse transcriptase Ty1/copia-type domain-containing protein n=1 Tax=Aristolochia fimbriata TaxID=158543 RepID=A0AAV7EP82_ARIFI|nr:hypothetical protein H6P81_010324 [Aristolochia fimbriata]